MIPPSVTHCVSCPSTDAIIILFPSPTLSPLPAVGNWLNWKDLAIACASIVFPFIIAMFFVPESPMWAVGKGKEFTAVQSLEWLRGRDDQAGEGTELSQVAVTSA